MKTVSAAEQTKTKGGCCQNEQAKSCACKPFFACAPCMAIWGGLLLVWVISYLLR